MIRPFVYFLVFLSSSIFDGYGKKYLIEAEDKEGKFFYSDFTLLKTFGFHLFTLCQIFMIFGDTGKAS